MNYDNQNSRYITPKKIDENNPFCKYKIVVNDIDKMMGQIDDKN